MKHHLSIRKTLDAIMTRCQNYDEAILVCQRIINLSPYREMRYHYGRVKWLAKIKKLYNQIR